MQYCAFLIFLPLVATRFFGPFVLPPDTLRNGVFTSQNGTVNDLIVATEKRQSSRKIKRRRIIKCAFIALYINKRVSPGASDTCVIRYGAAWNILRINFEYTITLSELYQLLLHFQVNCFNFFVLPKLSCWKTAFEIFDVPLRFEQRLFYCL